MNLRTIARRVAAAACLAMLPGCMALSLLSMEPEQRAALFLVPADKAVIYLYQDERGGDAAPVALSIDGNPVAAPGAGGFAYREVNPGEHTVMLTGADADIIVLKVDAGRVYFVGQHVECLASRQHMYLHAADEAAGRARVRALVAARKSPLPDDTDTAAVSPQCEPARGNAPDTVT